MEKMSDIFLQEDLEELLRNKFIVIIGDSIQRAIYKDFVLLLQRNRYLSDNQLRAKGEHCFENDELIEGGKKGQMNNGTGYREVRQYQSDYHLIRFYFVTRCYNTYMESILSDLSQDPKPDIVIMNSCLWDISRYGTKGIDEYKINLQKLFERFKEVFSEDTMVIWNATLPIAKNARGGFLVPEIEFMSNTLRLDILEANFFARQIVVENGFDLLDLHYYLRNQLHRRAGDGIHWDMTAHRRITNLLLSHIAEAWKTKTPGRTRKLMNVNKKTNDNEIKHNEDNNRNIVSRSVPCDNFKRIESVGYSKPASMRAEMGMLPVRETFIRQTQMDFESRYGGPVRKMDYSFNSPQNYYQQQQNQYQSNFYNDNSYNDNKCLMNRNNNYDSNYMNNMFFTDNNNMNNNFNANNNINNSNSYIDFQWQPYAQDTVQCVDRSMYRRPAMRDNPYQNRSTYGSFSWNGY